MNKTKKHLLYQFKISLLNIKPKIWRRIIVPGDYSFWDLHVAIQDSMGWLDYHLHLFRLRPKHMMDEILIGIPEEGWDTEKMQPGWEIPISDHFEEPGKKIIYEYDFGDGWVHEILLEGILLKTGRAKYPKCLDGKRACPPEDCGGEYGYYNLVKALENPNHGEYEDYVEWFKGHAKKYFPYKPDVFTPKKVRFDNPKKRLEEMSSPGFL